MLALGLRTGPVTAVLIAALLITASRRADAVNDHPQVFWASSPRCMWNLMRSPQLPLVGCRELCGSLTPISIAHLCLRHRVYEVNPSIVDVWIMLIMGVVGYGWRNAV